MRLDTLLYSRGAYYITRYHNTPTRRESSVAEHSYGVANIVLFLTYGEASAALLKAALHHDLAEITTGDIPAPVKRESPGIKEAIQSWEERVCMSYGIMQEELSLAEHDVLKFADKYEGLLYTMEEYDMGNRLILPVLYKWVEYLYDLSISKEGTQLINTQANELMSHYRHWARQRGL